MSFKDNLRGELDFQGLTVKELATKIGINKHTLDSYLSGYKSMPAADVAVKIALALNVTVEYLVIGETGQGLRRDDIIPHRDIIAELNKLSPEAQTIVKPLIIAMLRAVKETGKYYKV